MGDSGGLVFNDNPDIVRQLIKIYNKQKLFFNIKLVSFLNTEGIAARIVSTPVDDVLGYRAELSNNLCDKSGNVTIASGIIPAI